MQKICGKYALFQKYLGKVKIVKNCKKPREKCIFSAYFLHIFCIFFAYFIKNQRKLPKIGNMQKICRKYALFSRFFAIFDYFDLSQIFLEKCIFSAYFLHIANFWQFSLIFNEICKQYAENMQKICTFLEVFCNFWLFWPFPNIFGKVHIFRIFFAYRQFLAIFFDF